MQNSLDTNTCTVCESKLGLRVGVSARVNSWGELFVTSGDGYGSWLDPGGYC